MEQMVKEFKSDFIHYQMALSIKNSDFNKAT